MFFEKGVQPNCTPFFHCNVFSTIFLLQKSMKKISCIFAPYLVLKGLKGNLV